MQALVPRPRRLVEPGQRRRRRGVVLDRHARVVGRPDVGVGVVVGRELDDRSRQDVGVGPGPKEVPDLVARARPRARRGPRLGPDGRPLAPADHQAPAAVAEQVAHLRAGKARVPVALADRQELAPHLPVHQAQQRRVGRPPRRRARPVPRPAARGEQHLARRRADPLLEHVLHRDVEGPLVRQLREQHVAREKHVVPVEGQRQVALALHVDVRAVVLVDVLEVGRVVGRAVHPGGGPEQVVAVRGRVVKDERRAVGEGRRRGAGRARHLGRDPRARKLAGAVVLEPARVGPLVPRRLPVEAPGRRHQLVVVGRVVAVLAEDEGRGHQGADELSREVRGAVGRVDDVGRAAHLIFSFCFCFF